MIGTRNLIDIDIRLYTTSYLYFTNKNKSNDDNRHVCMISTYKAIHLQFMLFLLETLSINFSEIRKLIFEFDIFTLQ